MKYFIAVGLTILLLSNCSDTSSKKELQSETSESSYLEEGQTIANATFVRLSGNLQKAMKEGGVSNAVKYCNMAASPLVDSLEQLYKVKIKRTSLKVRNQKNIPNKNESKQLQVYQKDFESGADLKPVVQEFADQINFYAPIHVMPLCKKCHGKIGEDILEEDYATIQELYPSDKAINYDSGDLRGMWSITFSGK